jgi:hypothetical protein
MKVFMRFNLPVISRGACAVAALTLGAGVFAQTTAKPAEAPPPASQPASSSPADKPPSSLDDLLKIDREKPKAGDDASKQPAAGSAEEAAAAQAKREIDKQLSEAEVANDFVQAVEKMGVAADMLDVRFDPGLGTQRVQEDILAKLTQLLDQAKKNKSKSSSSSSSSSRQRNAQQPQNPGSKQQNQNQSEADQRNRNPSDNRSEIDPPSQEQTQMNSVLQESRSEWGNLPQRLRDSLLQGRKDKFSTLYERLTWEYYKRLAEENSP